VTTDELIRRFKEIRALADAVVDAMQNCERPSIEDAGIAYVCGEEIVEIVARLELDLIAEELAA
jgi:hypothetical protein